MGNTQGIWILYGALLTLNFLNANVQKIAAERHWIIETAKLNQSVCHKSVLTSKLKLKNTLSWGEVMPLFTQETKSYTSLQNYNDLI